MVQQVDWGDGSGDKIYLTYDSASGNQTVAVSSDANEGAARSKTVTFTTTAGGTVSKSLTVSQAAAPRQYTVRLVPSAYSVSSSSYVTVTNPSNMYENTDDTSNYATLRGRAGRRSNSTYYVSIRGFNFDAVPSGATVDSFTVKIRCYRNSYQNTGSSYRLKLCYAANTSLSNTATDTDIDTTQKVITIPNGGRTWAQITNYGANLGIQVPLRNTSTSSNYYPYVYVYGAEIEVKYTL